MSPARPGEGLPEGVFHLISSHEVVWTHRVYPAYVALCGQRVESSGMVGTDCPNECECEFSGSLAYCPACLCVASEERRTRLAGSIGGVPGER